MSNKFAFGSKFGKIGGYCFICVFANKKWKEKQRVHPNWIPAMSNADKINSPKVVALFGCLQIILLRFNHKWWLHCLAFYPTVFGMNSNKDSPVSNIQHNHNSNGLNCINTNREREVPFHSYLGSCLVPRPLKVMSIKATVLHVNAQLEGHLPHYGTTSMDVHTLCPGQSTGDSSFS